MPAGRGDAAGCEGAVGGGEGSVIGIEVLVANEGRLITQLIGTRRGK